MKTLAISLLSALTLAGTAFADHSVNVSGESGVALSGFDPVAFFTSEEAVNGDPGIKAEHEGATYFFASEENQKKFQADPAAYAPAYGGYCAYGVALGVLLPVDVDTAQVVDGKLYLNLNPAVLEAFNKDVKGNLTKADAEWQKLSVASH